MLGKPMRAAKGVLPAGEAIGLILAVTAVLWQLNLATGSSHHFIYIYLFPVALIAALYNRHLALFSAALALVCADYFLQAPLCTVSSMTMLANTATFLFLPFWLSQRSSSSEY